MGNYESYVFFIEQSVSLCSKNGWVSLITPDTWINIPQSQNIRRFIIDNSNVHLITVLSQKLHTN